MYHWMVYIHVLATFAFLLTHGVSSVVALRLRHQRDPGLARAWLQLNASGGGAGRSYGAESTLEGCGRVLWVAARASTQWHR